MSAIQVILSVFLAIPLALVIMQTATSRLVKYSIALVLAIGFVFVWFPDVTTYLANKAGVGRGTDLIFYVFTATALGLFVILFARTAQIQRNITEIIRLSALDKVRLPDGKQLDEIMPSDEKR